jgi:hypothetical protein
VFPVGYELNLYTVCYVEESRKKNNVIVRRKKKSKIKSGQGSQREARYPDLLVD